MKKICKFIVDHAKTILILFIPILILCALSIDKVNIEYSITSYLPASTDTKKALDIMDEEFVTYGTSTFLIRNITYEDASKLKDEIEELPGVKSLPLKIQKTITHHHQLYLQLHMMVQKMTKYVLMLIIRF